LRSSCCIENDALGSSGGWLSKETRERELGEPIDEVEPAFRLQLSDRCSFILQRSTVVISLDDLPPQLVALESALSTEFGGRIVIEHLSRKPGGPLQGLRILPTNPNGAKVVVFYTPREYLVMSEFELGIQSGDEVGNERADAWAFKLVTDIGRFGIVKLHHSERTVFGARDETVVLDSPDQLSRLVGENDILDYVKFDPW
jgi:hypothetical protein